MKTTTYKATQKRTQSPDKVNMETKDNRAQKRFSQRQKLPQQIKQLNNKQRNFIAFEVFTE